ncbi:MAG: radical SAM protein [Myxococcota bacterium]
MMQDTYGHSQQHLQEARNVTTFGSDHQIEIQLGHVCNNRCVFCVSGQMTERGLVRPIPERMVVDALETAAAQGVRKVTLLGGEPTLQKSFLPALRRAVDLGFEDIIIFTNGVKARRRSYVEQIVEMGRFTWRFSIQGANEEAHDRVVGRRGAFQRIVDGMTHLRDLGQDITANMCINEHSYRSLPDFPDLVRRHGIRQLHIDMIRPADAGDRTDAYLESIMPRYADMAPYIAEMLEGFEAIDPDFDVNIGNFPYCLLPEWAHKIHHDGEATMTYAADGTNDLSAPWDKYENKRSDKAHPPACDDCVFKPSCNGIFDKYAQFYGTDEFGAVRLEDLRRIDDRQHFFVLLVGDALRPLLRAPAPEGWRAAEVFRATRDRRVEVRYRDEGGRLATLVFTPPEGVGRPVEAPRPLLVTGRYRMSLQLDPGMEPEPVAGLVAWAEARLASSPGIEIREPADIGRIVAALTSPDRLDQARSRILRLSRRVQQRRRFGSWRYEATRPLEGGLGAILELRGPAGGSVELVLEVQSDPDRPPVGVSYRLGPSTDAETARGVLSDVMGALRR